MKTVTITPWPGDLCLADQHIHFYSSTLRETPHVGPKLGQGIYFSATGDSMEDSIWQNDHTRSSPTGQSVPLAPQTSTPRRSIELVRSGSNAASASGLLTVSPCQHQPADKHTPSSAPSVHMSYASATKSSTSATPFAIPISATPLQRTIQSDKPSQVNTTASLQHHQHQQPQPQLLATSTSNLRQLSSSHHQPPPQHQQKQVHEPLSPAAVLKVIAKEVSYHAWSYYIHRLVM